MAAADIGEGGAEGDGKGGRCGDAEVLLCSPMCCFTCFMFAANLKDKLCHMGTSGFTSLPIYFFLI